MSSWVPLPNSASIPDRSAMSRKTNDTTLGGAFGLDGDGRGVYAGDVGVLGMEGEIRVDVDYEGFAVVILRHTLDSYV